MDYLLHTEEKALDRLSQMGLSENALTESVWQGYLARSRTTINHPRIARGIIMWAETVAVLREQLISYGWVKEDKGNYELSVNQKAGLAIVVTTGDEATGMAGATPSNKCPKGVNTAEAIETNNQLDLFFELLPVIEDVQGFTTWVLLMHLATDEVRCELSLPFSISNGKINGWRERIILPSMPLDDDSVEINAPDLPDIEVPIKKKA
ncbi:hypothetical protein [Spongiibacter tropicus]|uniref:hypothetical protein n=1 Tax=Spongiibacter tropicus TaxID=454602 RepID=UPI000C466E3E|nr:hypothetical protein [Spongiibacter tropicus]MBI56867.1 hypothetical protein [Spongiibacter sp.]